MKPNDSASTIPPTGADPSSGQSLGKYRLLRPLGAGGMGVVVEAEDTVLHRRVALKMLADNLAHDREMLARFLREARAAARVSHPHVVPIYDVDTVGSAAYLVMEHLAGGSVQQLLQRSGKLPWQQATSLILQAARGLAAAHGAGLIHRDVKPANLLLSADGVVKVADFGLVKIVDGAESFSQSSRVLGTPHFMSPEQCRGESLDERTDIYSLAATWFTLITGRVLFESENAFGLLYAHCSSPLPDPRTHVPELPEAVVVVLKRGLERSRSGRFATMNDFALALERLLVTNTGPMVPPNLAASESKRPILRRTALVGLAAATLAVGVAAWFLWPRPEKRLPAVDAEKVKVQLKEANPNWKGKFDVRRDSERIVGLILDGDELKNLTPLKELRDLESFHYEGSGWDHQNLKSKLSDIGPLTGLPLKRLALRKAPIKDLNCLQSLTLEELDLEGCTIESIAPLAGMPLRSLNLSSTRVQDLGPLANCSRLETLHVGTYGVTRLDAVSQLPLRRLSLSSSRVSDLRPIRKCPLVYLECIFVQELTTLADLDGMPIEELRCKESLLPTMPNLPRLRSVNDKLWTGKGK